MKALWFAALALVLIGSLYLATFDRPNRDPVATPTVVADPLDREPVTTLEPESAGPAREQPDARGEVASAIDPEESTVLKTGTSETHDPEPGGLVVRVLDASGNPVPGLAVDLMVAVVGNDGKEDDRGSAVTRHPDGLAHLSLEGFEELRQRFERLGIKAWFAVRADIAAASPVETVLDGWPKDGDGVDLVLPAAGSVEVSIVDTTGQAVEGEAGLSWSWLPADVAGNGTNQNYESAGDHYVVGEQRPFRIDRVGLDVALSLRATVKGRAPGRLAGIAGPTTAGEVVAVEVQIGEPLAELRFICLDDSGEPWADERVTPHFLERTEFSGQPLERKRRSGGNFHTTGQQGQVSLTLVPQRPVFEKWLEVYGRRPSREPGGEAEQWAGWAALPREFRAGEVHRLPDVIMQPAKTLLAGTVVDQEGAPVSGARVYFKQIIDPSRRVSWNSSDWVLQCDEGGGFELTDVCKPAVLALRVSADGFKGHSMSEVTTRQGDLRIELEPAEVIPRGTLKLQVDMPKGVPFPTCYLKLRREGGGSETPDWWSGSVLEFDYLKPGTWSVWVETRDRSTELGRVDDIVVRAGEVTEDPRLLPLDLTASARSVTVRFLKRDGSPWRQTSARTRLLGQGLDKVSQTDKRGDVTVILPAGVSVVDVGIADGGFTSVSVGPDEDLVSVTL